MEIPWLLTVSATSFLFLVLISNHFLHKQPLSKNHNLPPSPPSLPIIGHFHLLLKSPTPIHTLLQTLSNKYGPILRLSFGTKNVVVLSSPSAIQQVFTKHDVVFANRPTLLIGKYLNYNHTTIGALPYGEDWRNLRRVGAIEIFSTKRLNSFMNVIRDEVGFILKSLNQISGQEIELRPKLSEMSFNVVMRIAAGKRNDSEESQRFRDIITEIFELSGASNPGDFIPALRWVTYFTFEKRLKIVQKKSDSFLQRLVDEVREKRSMDGESKTIVEAMLRWQDSEPEYYTDDIIKGMILALLSAGTDTTAGTIEWAMSLLVNNPDVLSKAKAEIDDTVGSNRFVDESDLPNLDYIQSIVKETLRLYPITPLLAPHESSEDTTIGGYYVPRKTMLLVNAWAIHRDPAVWDDPTSFKPERFQIKGGSDEGYVPFGLGRRACPGAGLANRVMVLALAALIQCFEWERIGDEEVDMSQGSGIAMPKAKPLVAFFKSRHSMRPLLATL